MVEIVMLEITLKSYIFSGGLESCAEDSLEQG